MSNASESAELLQGVLQQLSSRRSAEPVSVTGIAGGGAVEVVLEGMERVTDVRISEDAAEDLALLGELVASAINDALARAREARLSSAAQLLEQFGVSEL